MPKEVKLGLAYFDSETIESNWAKKSQVGPGSSWARPILTRSQIGPRSQDGSQQMHQRTFKVDVVNNVSPAPSPGCAVYMEKNQSC